MKLPGYCTGCHKIKQVRVTNAALSRMAAKGSNVPSGVCASCEEENK